MSVADIVDLSSKSAASAWDTHHVQEMCQIVFGAESEKCVSCMDARASKHWVQFPPVSTASNTSWEKVLPSNSRTPTGIPRVDARNGMSSYPPVSDISIVLTAQGV